MSKRPEFTREERAAEFREMARDVAKLGNPGLALQCLLMARQIEREPTNMGEMLNDIFAQMEAAPK